MEILNAHCGRGHASATSVSGSVEHRTSCTPVRVRLGQRRGRAALRVRRPRPPKQRCDPASSRPVGSEARSAHAVCLRVPPLRGDGRSTPPLSCRTSARDLVCRSTSGRGWRWPTRLRRGAALRGDRVRVPPPRGDRLAGNALCGTHLLTVDLRSDEITR
jgi:hypothetical protein